MDCEILLALEISRVEGGCEYKHLPMHCTVMHWLPIKQEDIVEITNIARGIFNKYAPIHLHSKKHALFGINEDVQVFKLEKNDDLVGFHQDLCKEIIPFSLNEVEEMKWIGDNYSPHVTNVGDKTFDVGSKYNATCLYIVKRVGNVKEIHKRIS